MTPQQALLLGCVIVTLPHEVIIQMGHGKVSSCEAGVLPTFEQRDPNCLQNGVFTTFWYCLLVRGFDSPTMSLISANQARRQGIGFDYGHSSDMPGVRYKHGALHACDIPSLQSDSDGNTRREVHLRSQTGLGVPELNSVSYAVVQSLKLPQFDFQTGAPATPDALLSNLASSMQGTPYAKSAQELAASCRIAAEAAISYSPQILSPDVSAKQAHVSGDCVDR
jgi:hypothetical protein